MKDSLQQEEVRIAIPISVIWAIEEALMNPTAWGEKKAIMLVQYLQKERKATKPYRDEETNSVWGYILLVLCVAGVLALIIFPQIPH